MIYFDSSALVKRYLKETGSERVKSIFAAEKAIATSKLTYPEMLSVFMRKYRAREITNASLHAVVDRFESDWDHLYIVEFHDELLPMIRTLLAKYALKGADSVHLSSALWLRHITKEDVAFVVSDLPLLNAARSESLQIINPS